MSKPSPGKITMIRGSDRKFLSSFASLRSPLRGSLRLAISLRSVVIRHSSFFLLLTTVHALDLALPTANTALFHDGGPAFYQYIERDFNGVKSTPWQGGQYGFVRDPIETAGGLVFRRFHEGIDIKPLRRDASGIPLDEVRAVADGQVVYTSLLAGASNYGRYVVIRHLWSGCPYYSLYAHLNKVLAQPGQEISRGQTIGILGFTGDGINLTRAHLHFEINLFLSNDFEAWHQKYFPGEINRHGLYNGLNLTALNAADLLKKNRANPALTVPDFLRSAEVFYKVRVPAPGPVGLARRYPWMAADYRRGAAEISFARSGLPLKIEATQSPGDKPVVSWVRQSAAPLRYLTKNYLGGTSSAPTLSKDGLRYLDLLCGK